MKPVIARVTGFFVASGTAVNQVCSFACSISWPQPRLPKHPIRRKQNHKLCLRFSRFARLGSVNPHLVPAVEVDHCGCTPSRHYVCLGAFANSNAVAGALHGQGWIAERRRIWAAAEQPWRRTTRQPQAAEKGEDRGKDRGERTIGVRLQLIPFHYEFRSCLHPYSLAQ